MIIVQSRISVRQSGNKSMPEEVVSEAIKRARLHGTTNVSYVERVLNNWKDAGVINMAGIERVDKEFERKKKGGAIRGPTNQSNGKSGNDNQQIRGPDAGKEKFPGYDRSKFEFPG